MFLDAATVLHAQPLTDLRCAWTTMIQLNNSPDDPVAAACSGDAIVAELITSSLVSIDGSRQDWQACIPINEPSIVNEDPRCVPCPQQKKHCTIAT